LKDASDRFLAKTIEEIESTIDRLKTEVAQEVASAIGRLQKDRQPEFEESVGVAARAAKRLERTREDNKEGAETSPVASEATGSQYYEGQVLLEIVRSSDSAQIRLLKEYLSGFPGLSVTGENGAEAGHKAVTVEVTEPLRLLDIIAAMSQVRSCTAEDGVIKIELWVE